MRRTVSMFEPRMPEQPNAEPNHNSIEDMASDKRNESEIETTEIEDETETKTKTQLLLENRQKVQEIYGIKETDTNGNRIEENEANELEQEPKRSKSFRMKIKRKDSKSSKEGKEDKILKKNNFETDMDARSATESTALNADIDMKKKEGDDLKNTVKQKDLNVGKIQKTKSPKLSRKETKSPKPSKKEIRKEKKSPKLSRKESKKEKRLKTAEEAKKVEAAASPSQSTSAPTTTQSVPIMIKPPVEHTQQVLVSHPLPAQKPLTYPTRVTTSTTQVVEVSVAKTINHDQFAAPCYTPTSQLTKPNAVIKPMPSIQQTVVGSYSYQPVVHSVPVNKMVVPNIHFSNQPGLHLYNTPRDKPRNMTPTPPPPPQPYQQVIAHSHYMPSTQVQTYPQIYQPYHTAVGPRAPVSPTNIRVHTPLVQQPLRLALSITPHVHQQVAGSKVIIAAPSPRNDNYTPAITRVQQQKQHSSKQAGLAKRPTSYAGAEATPPVVPILMMTPPQDRKRLQHRATGQRVDRFGEPGCRQPRQADSPVPVDANQATVKQYKPKVLPSVVGTSV